MKNAAFLRAEASYNVTMARINWLLNNPYWKHPKDPFPAEATR